jgi:hypothetical protein
MEKKKVKKSVFTADIGDVIQFSKFQLRFDLICEGEAATMLKIDLLKRYETVRRSMKRRFRNRLQSV